MTFDMQQETARHRAGWLGFATLMGGALAGVALVLIVLALTLL